MLFRIVKQSFMRQKKAMALMVISVSMGTAIAASLASLSLDIGGKVSRELRSFGANINIVPMVDGLALQAGQRRYLREGDIAKAKTIFWRHNILGISPVLKARAGLTHGAETVQVPVFGAWLQKDLPMPGEEDATFMAGVLTVSPWWKVTGSAPDESSVMLGTTLSKRLGLGPGAEVEIDGKKFKVSGVIDSGDSVDSGVFMDLGVLQRMKGLEGRISKVLVSALTTPMDEFAYTDPKKMSTAEYEKWYCTGYVTSIAKQLEEVFKGSRAKPIWHIAETEGKVLKRMSLLIYMLSAAALLAAAFGVSTTMVAGLLRRVREIGLMKTIGADSVDIGVVFLTEALLIGAVGGALGYVISLFVSHFIGTEVFGSALTDRGILLPASVLSALVIAALGSLLPIKRALAVRPVVVLKGGA